MSPIKTCVLGVGLSGLTYHAPFLLALPELFELHSVLERNPKSPGGKTKERFGIDVKIHRSFEDVVKDEAIELVIVGTPNATHYEFVKGALEAGKHGTSFNELDGSLKFTSQLVLVDKPAVPSAAEARELGELARSKGLVLYAYQNCRWNSDFLALRRLLSEPPSSPVFLGKIVDFESQCAFLLIYTEFSSTSLHYSYDRYRDKLKGDWKEVDVPGSGQVYNLGSHLIDQALVLFGRPTSVTGFISNVRGLGNLNVDDSVSLVCEFALIDAYIHLLDAQFTIFLHYPTDATRKHPLTVLLRSHPLSVRSPQLRFVIRGTKGTFIKYGMDVQESQLRIMPDPKGIFAHSYGREPEEICGTVETIDSRGNMKSTS